MTAVTLLPHFLRNVADWLLLYGRAYQLDSGVGLGVGVLAGWWRTHNCHVHRCPWIQWHAHPRHGHPVCKRHHPHGQGRGDHLHKRHHIHRP